MEISKSFSQKIQIREFEPIEFFCSAKAEVEEAQKEIVSKDLYEYCVRQVEADIRRYRKEHGIPDSLWQKIHNEDSEREDQLKNQLPIIST